MEIIVDVLACTASSVFTCNTIKKKTWVIMVSFKWRIISSTLCSVDRNVFLGIFCLLKRKVLAYCCLNWISFCPIVSEVFISFSLYLITVVGIATLESQLKLMTIWQLATRPTTNSLQMHLERQTLSHLIWCKFKDVWTYKFLQIQGFN